MAEEERQEEQKDVSHGQRRKSWPRNDEPMFPGDVLFRMSRSDEEEKRREQERRGAEKVSSPPRGAERRGNQAALLSF